MTQPNQVPQNPTGQSAAATPAGTGNIAHGMEIGAMNGIIGTKDVLAQPSPPPATQAAPVPTQQPVAQQPSEKDIRHFSRFVTEATEKQFLIAKIAVEANADAIYDIAKNEPKIAERLLKEYNYGTDSVEELLKKHENPEIDPRSIEKEIENDKWKKQMEESLLEERILRLKGEHSDLQGELEKTFREVYSDPAFEQYDTDKKLAVARALSGKESQTISADDVAAAMLRQQEGSVPSPRGTTETLKVKSETPEFRRMRESMNISDKDLEILPENIDEILSQTTGINFLAQGR